MFTENEVGLILENVDIEKAVIDLRKDFISHEAQFMELSDHDFLSLVLLTPAISIALANGSVSLFEELELNKRARKLSKGGYFMKKDPVVIVMGHLIEHYDKWEEKFFALLRSVMNTALDFDSIIFQDIADDDITPDSFRKEVLKAPYGFVRFLASFFCSNDDEILNVESRKINKTEYERMIYIGDKLNLKKVPIFRHFCATYEVKG